MPSRGGDRASEPGEQFQESPEPTQASSTTVTRSSRAGLGRSGPRSRSGCVTCKQRRVRCDEVHPVCGHCTRLQLVCRYKSPSFGQRWRQQSQPPNGQEAAAAAGRDSNSPPLSGSAQLSLARYNRQKAQQNALPETPPAAFAPLHSRSGYATPTSNQYNLLLPGVQQRRFDFSDIFSDLNASWAGETLCMLPDSQEPSGMESSFPLASFSGVESHFGTFTGLMDLDNAAPLTAQEEEQLERPRPNRPVKRRGTIETLASIPPEGVVQDGCHVPLGNHDSTQLIQLFRKIVQPPAAILIGGFERWRRLQHYLCQLSEHSRAVRSSLLCVIELLLMDDDVAREHKPDSEACMKRILERHAAACDEIRSKTSKHADLKPKTKEHLLAAIFLLSWFEVIRDQDARSDLFPRHLADIIITGDTAWSRYSQQLLSWLNTLDSKASHLGGEHLLSPKCLEVVSHFPTKITSALDHGETGKDPDDSEFAVSDMSPCDYSHHSPEDVTSHSPSLSTCQVKQVVLNTILQPALEWYLTSQSYCRRISTHDKHHRKRFTSDDEYEVITACKGLESALFELWEYRPAVISLDAKQLGAIVAPDIAKRLEEIFSVYLASFWILFVYLHRVSWWNLPHSALATRALAEVWQDMQRAYGEEVNGPLRKVIHPSLLWPLFLFGSECPDQSQRTWAIEQLEALGEAKPVLQSEEVDSETLPPFKLSSGATRNAKRAAALLRELIKEQNAKQARVDDRDLSMRMFGCYFSIV